MRKILRRTIGLLVLALGLAVAGVVGWAPDVPVAQLQPRWARPPSTFVEVQGMRVHLRDEGPRDDPEPIVLLHGTSASLHTWEGWTRALTASAPARRVIRFDLPGFGLTGPHPRDDYTIDAYVSFVGAMLEALEVPRAVIGGNSLGGQIAWAFAHAQPQRVTKLILVDASGYAPKVQSMPIGFRLAAIPWLAPLIRNVLPRSVVEASVRNVYGDPSRVTAALVDEYHDMARREGNRRALSLRLAAGYQGNEAHIRELNLPTLVLWGRLDRLVPPERADDFARDIAGSRKVVFEQLGHVPHEEDPKATVAEVLRFVQRP
jgi:pimeloyl-ACP methyl ester carboxylesterase